MFCPFCGHQITDDMQFCVNCGQKLPNEVLSGGQEEPERAEESVFIMEEEDNFEPMEAEEISLQGFAEMEDTFPEEIPVEETIPDTGSIPVGVVPPEPAAEPVLAIQQPHPQPAVKAPRVKEPKVKAPKVKAEKQPNSKTVKLVLIALGALVGLCLILFVVLSLTQPAWLPFDLPQIRLGKGASTDYLAVLYQRDNNVEIELAKRKESVLIVEDVSVPSLMYSTVFWVADGRNGGMLNAPADFIPGTDLVLLQTMEDGETSLFLSHGDKTPENLIFSSTDFFRAYAKEDGTIIIIERRDSGARAYVSENLEEAERVYKADVINYIEGRDEFLAIERESSDDGEMETYTLVDISGEEIAEIYDGPTVEEREITAGGKFMALRIVAEDGDEVVVIDLNTHEEVASNEEYASIKSLSSADTGDVLYLVGEDEDGFLSIDTFFVKQWETVLEGQIQLWLDLSWDGEYMAVVTYDEDSEQYQVLSVDVRSAAVTEFYTSDQPLQLRGSIPAEPGYFLVTEKTEDALIGLSFYHPTGKSVEIFNEEDMPGNVMIQRFGKWLFVPGPEDGLWAFTLDGKNGFVLFEDWFMISVVAINEAQDAVILSGMEDQGDDLELYWVELAEDADPIVLDDEGVRYQTVFFRPGGKSILYNIWTGLDDYDEMEIRSATIEKKPVIETLYDEGYFSGVAWMPYWDSYERGTLFPRSSIEGSASRTLAMDEIHALTMPSNTQEMQFKLRLQPDFLYSVYVTAGEAAAFDPTITLTTLDGEEIDRSAFNDTVDEGIFFSAAGRTEVLLTISNEETAQSEVNYEVWTVSIDPLETETGSSIDGEITESDQRSSPTSTWYEDIYVFDLAEGQQVTAALTGNANLDYFLYVLDPNLDFISLNMGSMAVLDFSAGIAGKHYLIVLEVLEKDVGFDPDLDHTYLLDID